MTGNNRFFSTSWSLSLLLLLAPACDRLNPQSPGYAREAAGSAEEESHDPHEGHDHDRDQDHGHEHGSAPERSDLDRPVEELLEQTCEHGVKTYQCAECRYETGFVRVPKSVLEGGLIRLTRAEPQRIAVPVTLTGEVRFDERKVGHVTSQVEGVIKQVHVALGDRVEQGQPLLEIESVVVGEGQAAYREAQGLVHLARRNFERVTALKQSGISSEKEFLQARQELEAAEIRSAGALGKLRRLGTGGSEGARVVLRAPIAGTVLRMHAVSGEVARTDESLLTVGDSSAVWVWADLYERDLAAVKQGQAVQPLAASVLVKAYPGEQFPGVVDLVSPAMDESSRTVKVRVQVDHHDGRLLAGMFASIQVFLPGQDQALAVPGLAVLEDEGRSFVFVHHRDDDYLRRPVVVGRRWAGWVEIVQGLKPAQTVVAEGAFLLKSDVLRSKMGAGCAD